MKRRNAILASSLVAAILIVVAGAAWACTAYRTLGGPQSGPPLSQVTMTGTANAGSLAEIHWNSLDGPIVGRAIANSNEQLSAQVTIPDVAPGIYYLMAVHHGTGVVARTAFEVTSPNPVASTSSQATVWDTQPGFVSTSAPSASGPGLAVGVALLSVGVAGLTAGAVVAVNSRRRARVGPT